MSNTYNKYSKIHDKFDSLYIFVIYNSRLEQFTEKISKIIKPLDSISDSKKKGYLKNRLYEFQKYIVENNINNIVEGIYFVSNIVHIEPLDNQSKETLKFFNHPNISYNYGNKFSIEWLNDLLYNKDYVNVFNIKNNDIKYWILNETKKKLVYQNTIKSMDIKSVIESNIIKKDGKMDKYLLYGISNLFKNYNDTNCFNLSTKDLTDEEIMKYFNMDKYKKNNLELKDILENISQPKYIDKYVYGKEILTELENYMLEIIYVTLDCSIIDKIKEFNIIIKYVESFEKGDIIDNFKNNFGGIIGKKYY